MIPACYPVPVFAEMDPRQFFPSSNLSALPLPHYPPKSLPLNLFADPHPLNPVVPIFYKNMGGEGCYRPLWSYLVTGTLTRLISFVCHSYENAGGVGLFFPFWNSSLPGEPCLLLVVK